MVDQASLQVNIHSQSHIELYSMLLFSSSNESDVTSTMGSNCEEIQAYFGPITQNKFALIAKYVIMVLAALNIIREVRPL